MSENSTPVQTIEDRIQAAIAEAHAICDKLGSTSQECAVAWDVVEELQAEASHQKQIPQKTAFQKYCDANPEADECRIYDD
ncbi:MAG TPA: Calvin cycle protein CP12 [Synechococcales cyanobacterium M55_K2018_004]|nr:Calvin cycle protein CP12 [Synechococcales cyanobacterium M55_K2018_004]